MKKFIIFISIFLFFSCTSESRQVVNGFFSQYISAQELKYMIDNKESYILIDLRSNMDYNNGHIKTAVNIPYFNIENRIQDYQYQLFTIIIYSHDTSHQKQVLKTLKSMGYEDVKMLSGGLWEWDYGLIID